MLIKLVEWFVCSIILSYKSPYILTIYSSVVAVVFNNRHYRFIEVLVMRISFLSKYDASLGLNNLSFLYYTGK